MNNPLVSIIVPVYNVQNSVARCLESICAQTWKDIEIILVNDGSRDESFSVCEQFREKDPRIVLVDKSNSGVSDTRNCGMTLASGKYVQFVDSDDYIEPDFTERLVTAAETNNADLVIAPYWMVIPANSCKAGQALESLQENLGIEEKRPDDVREYGFLPEGIYDRDTFALRLMEKPASFFYSVLWNKLYRRDILVDNHLQFTSEVRWAEDLVFNLEYILYANVFVSIPKAGYHYVQNPQSIHRAEQAAGVPLLQRSLHKAGPVRQGAAAAVQIPDRILGECLSRWFAPEDHHGHGQPLGLWCSGCFRQGKETPRQIRGLNFRT